MPTDNVRYRGNPILQRGGVKGRLRQHTAKPLGVVVLVPPGLEVAATRTPIEIQRRFKRNGDNQWPGGTRLRKADACA